MGSYEPISPQGLGWNVPDFAHTILAAREAQRQQEADRWAQVRDQSQMQHQKFEEGIQQHQQGQNDEDRAANIMGQIQKLHDAGLGHQAEQLAQLHGYTLQQPAAAPGAPPAPSQAPAQAPAAPQAPAMEPTDQDVQARSDGIPHLQLPTPYSLLSGEELKAQRTDLAQNHALEGRTEEHPDKTRRQAAEDMGAFNASQGYGIAGQQAMIQSGMAEQDRATALLAYQAQQAQPAAPPQVQSMVSPPTTKIASYRGPGGHSFSIDPTEARNAQQSENARRAEMFRAAFAKDPALAPYAGEAGAQVELGLEDPKAVFAGVRAEMLAKEKSADEAKKEAEKVAHAKEASPLAFEQEKELARINAGGRVTAARAGQAPKIDAETRGDRNLLRQEQASWARENQLAVDSKSAKRLATVTANINSGNAMQQREAAESMVSIFKGGGQVTKASQDLLLAHLSGIVGDAQTWLQHLETGHYGAQELGVLKQAAEGALSEERERAQTYYQSYVDRFGPGNGLDNYSSEINHHAQSYFRQFGLAVPPVYAQAAPAPQMGGATKGTPKSARPPTAHDDAAMVNKARAVLADPRETPERKAKAQQVIDLNSH